MNDLVLATVHKNGSSLAVVIPRNVCVAMGIKRGDQMVVSVLRNGGIVFNKLTDGHRLKVIKF